MRLCISTREPDMVGVFFVRGWVGLPGYFGGDFCPLGVKVQLEAEYVHWGDIGYLFIFAPPPPIPSFDQSHPMPSRSRHPFHPSLHPFDHDKTSSIRLRPSQKRCEISNHLGLLFAFANPFLDVAYTVMLASCDLPKLRF